MTLGRMATFLIWLPLRDSHLINLTIHESSRVAPRRPGERRTSPRMVRMQSYDMSRAQSVEARGAAAGSVVHGAGANNRGLRIRVLCEQPRGHGGALRGAFVILDVGDNKHSHALHALLGRETNAAEVLRVSRSDSSSCVSAANANSLVPEACPRKAHP